jgi:arylsulfatase A-like enzyme
MSRQKLLDNTVIVFTSDHGDMLGDHHLWRKTYAYEGSAHIPMIVRLPGSAGKPLHRRCDRPVSLFDIMPTLLDAAGLNIPDSVDGSSMLKLMREPSPEWREYVHGEHSRCYAAHNEMQYVTDGRWKYIWLPQLDREQLFDLAADPGECRDLADHSEYQDRLRYWRERLVAELAPRDLGLTDGERLVGQAGKPPIVSPSYKERIGNLN